MSTQSAAAPPLETPERLAFSERIGQKHLTPLWTTDATIFVAVEGRGRSRIGTDFIVEWQPRDIFVVPSRKRVAHDADDEAAVFSFSDRRVQEALQLFREDRHDA